MRRFIAIMMFLLALCFQTFAQVDYGFGNVVKKKRDLKHIPTIGVKGGLTFYDMSFSDKDYDKLPGKLVMNPGYGVFVEYDVNMKVLQGLSIGAELMSISRGYKKEFDFRGSIREIDKMDSKYIDFRIPISYYFLNNNNVSPYIFVAPDFAYCHGGSWSKSFPDDDAIDDISVDISQSDAVIAPFDISLNMGVGVRFKLIRPVYSLIFKLDGSYNMGLMNVKTSNDGTPVDVYAYSFDEETRQNKGIELMLSIGLPLQFNKHHDACWGW